MRILNKFGLIVVQKGRILLCRPYAFPDLILPGGVIEGNEEPLKNFEREIKEELGPNAKVDPNSLTYLGSYRDIAAGKVNTAVEIKVYLGKVKGELTPSSEIKELVWFSPRDDVSELSPIIRNKILPDLIKRGLLSRKGGRN